MPSERLAFAGVTRLAELLRDREVSARELADVFLERIERLNPVFNCFVDVFYDAAIDQAVAADQMLARGETKPLLGVPIAIKDNVDIAGYVTGDGTASGAAGEPASDDAAVVARLRAAGAVFLGKTSLPEFAMWGHFTQSATHGITRNPWNLDYSPGGSSGGSAVAVAAGLAAAAFASDGGGSIRLPSAHCGLFGLKPSRGRVSLAPSAEHWSGLSVYGSVARSAADSALMLDVMAGPEPGDKHVAQAPDRPFAEYAAEDPPKLRIGVVAQAGAPGIRLRSDRRHALEHTASRLRSLGHDVTVVEGRYPLLLPLFLPRYLAGIDDDSRRRGHEDLLEERTRTALRIGRLLPPGMLRRSLADEPAYAEEIENRLFSGRDVLLTPVIPKSPQPVTKSVGKGWLSTTWDANEYVSYTAPWNLTGQPAASVPVGRDANGLPLAVQLVGRYGDDGLLYSLGGQLERERAWSDEAIPPSARDCERGSAIRRREPPQPRS